MGIIAHLLETELRPERREVVVIGVRQRVRQVDFHAAEPQPVRRGNHLLAQTRQRHRHFDRGAGLKPGTQRDLLIDHAQHAAGLRIDDYHRAVIRTERLDSRPPDRQILAVHEIARRRIGISRFRPGAAPDDRTGDDGRPLGVNDKARRTEAAATGCRCVLTKAVLWTKAALRTGAAAACRLRLHGLA